MTFSSPDSSLQDVLGCGCCCSHAARLKLVPSGLPPVKRSVEVARTKVQSYPAIRRSLEYLRSLVDEPRNVRMGSSAPAPRQIRTRRRMASDQAVARDVLQLAVPLSSGQCRSALPAMFASRSWSLHLISVMSPVVDAFAEHSLLDQSVQFLLERCRKWLWSPSSDWIRACQPLASRTDVPPSGG